MPTFLYLRQMLRPTYFFYLYATCVSLSMDIEKFFCIYSISSGFSFSLKNLETKKTSSISLLYIKTESVKRATVGHLPREFSGMTKFIRPWWQDDTSTQYLCSRWHKVDLK